MAGWLLLWHRYILDGAFRACGCRGVASAGSHLAHPTPALLRLRLTPPRPQPSYPPTLSPSAAPALSPSHPSSAPAPAPPPLPQAYPSTSNIQQLSYRSDGSYLAAETPRSGDGGELERKVRGGMSRSLSHACGLSSPLPASLPAGQVQASLIAWERSGAGRRSASSLAERGASSSSLGSPGGESVLLGPPSAPLSPQQSPLALSMGGGYSRVVVQPPAQQQHGPTRVQAVPFVHDGCAVTAAGAAGAAVEVHAARVVEVRAEMVQRGTHLSRTATDTAGLVQAVDMLARAAAAAGMASSM